MKQFKWIGITLENILKCHAQDATKRCVNCKKENVYLQFRSETVR